MQLRGDQEPSARIYQHPLAYLLGLEGIALMRGFCGEFDREFTLARLDEARRLLDSAGSLGDGVEAEPVTTQTGYAQWAPFYDDSANQLLDIEGPMVREILDGLPVGEAVDAACGTGRHAEYLAELGHTVTGVDSSSDMLAVARAKVPDAMFLEGLLTALPLPDGSADLVVCGIALNHLPQLQPAYREFARVLRPGGHLVVSDRCGLLSDLVTPVVRIGADGQPGYMPSRGWRASDHLAAALPPGFLVRRCQEPRRPGPIVSADGSDPHTGVPSPAHEPGAPPNIWALHPLVIAAANAAWRDNPIAIIWQFQLAG